MEIRIFDVEHGFCGLVVGDNGNVMLADCGHNADTSFQPADFLGGNGIKTIDLFVPLNYDEDHLSGLPKLREKVWDQGDPEEPNDLAGLAPKTQAYRRAAR